MKSRKFWTVGGRAPGAPPPKSATEVRMLHVTTESWTHLTIFIASLVHVQQWEISFKSEEL